MAVNGGTNLTASVRTNQLNPHPSWHVESTPFAPKKTWVWLLSGFPSLLRYLTLNLRLRRECCRYVVGLFNKQKLVVLLVVSVFHTFLDLIFTVFGDFFFQWLLTSIPFWLKTQDQSFSHCYIMDTAYFSSPGPLSSKSSFSKTTLLKTWSSLESRNYQYKNDFQHL